MTVDPEEFLSDLGFADTELRMRIPDRFFQSASSAQGIDVDSFRRSLETDDLYGSSVSEENFIQINLNRMSKVSQECVAFALLWSMIVPQNKNHPRVKSEVKNQLQPVHSLFPRRKVASFHIEFSLAACNVSLVLIGCCDHFDRATPNQNALY